MMLAVVVTLLAFGLAVYGLIDIAVCAGRAPRRLPAWGWLLVILLVPFAGPIAWLVAGRPQAPRHVRLAPDPATGPADMFRGPEDDPAFLERLRRERG